MFKERLKNLRNKYTLTQEDLAKETNISEEKIVSYELGESKPDINTLLIFANYFEVSLDFILGRSLEKYEDNDKELVGIDFFVNAFKLQKVKRIILRLCLLIPIVNFFYIGRIVSYYDKWVPAIKNYDKSYMIQRHFAQLCFYLNILILIFVFIYMSKDRLKEIIPFLSKISKKKSNNNAFDNNGLFAISFFLLFLMYIFKIHYHISWISKHLFQ